MTLKWLVTYVCSPHCRHPKALLLSMTLYAIYLVFFTSFGIGWMGLHCNYYKRHMEKLFVSSTVGLNGVRNIDDFWKFAEGPMLDSLFLHPDGMNTTHIVIGGPTLRQVKVRKNSCEVRNEFMHLHTSCYDHYTASAEDQEPFGLGTTTPWVYSDRGRSSYQGLVTTYSGGGYHSDLPTNKTEALHVIRDLQEKKWLTQGTRAVFVDFVIYSANIDKICIAKLLVEFPPTGGALPSSFFEVVRPMVFSSSLDCYIVACEIISFTFSLYYILLEVLRIIYFRIIYIFKFWNLFELAAVCSTVTTLSCSFQLYVFMYWILDDLPWRVSVENFEKISTTSACIKNILSISLFLTWWKVIFFVCVGSNTLAKLRASVEYCIMNSLGFFVAFVLFLFACAHLTHHILGPHLREYCTLNASMSSLLRALLWEFDQEEIQRARPFIGPIILLIYYSLVITIMWSIPLAIFLTSHKEVMSEISWRYNLWDQLKVMVWGTRRCHQGTIMGQEEVRLALARQGLTSEGTKMMLSRFDVRPEQEVGIYHLQNMLGYLHGVEILPEAVLQKFSELKQRMDEAEQAMIFMAEKVAANMESASGGV